MMAPLVLNTTNVEAKVAETKKMPGLLYESIGPISHTYLDTMWTEGM